MCCLLGPCKDTCLRVVWTTASQHHWRLILTVWRVRYDNWSRRGNSHCWLRQLLVVTAIGALPVSHLLIVLVMREAHQSITVTAPPKLFVSRQIIVPVTEQVYQTVTTIGPPQLKLTDLRAKHWSLIVATVSSIKQLKPTRVGIRVRNWRRVTGLRKVIVQYWSVMLLILTPMSVTVLARWMTYVESLWHLQRSMRSSSTNSSWRSTSHAVIN